ncbi:MAG: energy transducer TonB [Zoogloeaceae bacterium]|jgi:protein TonB|nr:energy transducer TonB [Zoogloeaceae bacterium]
MTKTRIQPPCSPALLLALLFSLLAHVGLIFGLPAQWRHPAPPGSQTPLAARLVEPPPELALSPELPDEVELSLDAPDEPAPSPASSRPPPRAAPETTPLEKLAASARRQLNQLARQGDFYPLEAIQNHWQGEAWVQIFLDENGNVIAARVEESSGHPILDEAALKAARALKSLPADGLESVVLPVRFRLTQ